MPRLLPKWATAPLVILTPLALSFPLSSSLRADQLSCRLSVDPAEINLERVGGVVKVSIAQRGFAPLQQQGQPELPCRVVSFILPQGEEVEDYTVVAGSAQVIARGVSLYRSAPMLSEEGKAGRAVELMEPAGAGELFPLSYAKYMGTGYFHGYAIASFALFPLRYDGDRLLLTSRIELQVKTKPAAQAPDVAVRKRFREGFDQYLANTLSTLVVNPEAAFQYYFPRVVTPKGRGGFQPTAAPSLEGSPVDYLIITVDSLVPYYQRLADWKTAKGVPTVVRSIEWINANYRHGVDLQETIRFFIRDAYEKWGISWVLLGGDTDIIPTRYAISRFYGGVTYIPTDMYFACLDGSWNDTHDQFWGEGYYYVPLDNPDLYAEVYLGRLTASTGQDVNTIIDKIISYSTPMDMSYGDKVLMLAEVLFPVDWKPGDPISMNGAEFTQFVYNMYMIGQDLRVTRAYQTDSLYPGSVPESKQATIDSMNAGFNMICHVGHGFRFNLSVADGSILITDADALTNKDRYFFLYMLNCTAAAYDYSSLAEHFLLNPQGGAAAIIGANRSAFPNASSYYMDDFYDVLLTYGRVRIGEAFTIGRARRTPYAELSDNADLWTHYIYTLLSDPELAIWTAPVGSLEVAHVANVGMGENSMTVSVTSGGSPVDSALVCLSKGSEDYEHGYTNTSGDITLNFTCETPGSISVVVTAKNKVRHQSYIVVDSTTAPYVSFAGLTVDDDSLAGTFGNGDGSIDAGETVELTLSLINSGGAPSDSVWCIVRCADAGVTVIDSTAELGPIGLDETKSTLDGVFVHFDPVISDESSVEFALEVHNSTQVWNDTFRKVVHAPNVELVTVRIDDSPPLGDGDGIISPGEEFKLFVKIKNYGSGTAAGLQAYLTDIDGEFSFTDSIDTYPDLTRVSWAENDSGFTMSESDTLAEHRMEMTIVDLFGRSRKDSIELRPPIPPTSLTFDPSQGVDRIQVAWTASVSSDAVKYNVYHSLQSGGPYTLVSSDPCEHTVFMDMGLSPSTRYYYVVTAIDKSGNESDFSLESSASTNPPQLSGWPIAMAEWTSCTPAVGDIDGDRELEVIAGNDYVYAWNHDGVELRDGDADPQSWGVLNTIGHEYVAPITLARLDSLAGLDIVAISYDTKEVYCFNYHGDVLPGWPQSTETNARAAAVMADLEGDGDPEIVVVDQDGVIYAWHKDGTELIDGDGNPSTPGVFYRLSGLSSWHYQTPAACDLDGDGKHELVVGTQMDSVYVFNEDGSRVPGWPVAINGECAGSIPVGDVDDDGSLELVVPTKSTEVLLLNSDGTLETGWPRWIAHNNFFSPSPALGDMTGDGKLEIVIASSNGKVYAINYQGADLPGWPVVYSEHTYTESSPLLADVNGDGAPEVILGDESRFINAWDVSGNPVDGFPIALDDAVRATPTVIDLDQDGDVEMLVAGWDKNLYVWDMTGAYANNDPWPTFHANVHRNGLIGFEVPTAVKSAYFHYALRGMELELVWELPGYNLTAFNLYRAEKEGSSFGPFHLIARDLNSGVEGVIRFRDSDLDQGRSYRYRLEASPEPGLYMESSEIYLPVARAGLEQNFPNPFNPRTRIVFYVPETSGPEYVTLRVFDVRGKLVTTLARGLYRPGRYQVEWQGRDERGNPVASGVYFYQLREGDFVATRKMLLLK